MISVLLLSLAVQGATTPVRASTPVRAPTVTVRVTPEAPAIGDPITIELRVRAAVRSDVRFPVLPDTGTRLEPLDPRAMRDASTAEGIDRTAIYRLIAWDTGTMTPAFGDVIITRDGAVRRYPVVLAPMRIRSLLPADTTKRLPRPAADAIDAPSVRWRLWIVLVVIAGFAYLGWKRYRRWRDEKANAPPDAIGRARAGFAHVGALDLLSAGEPGRHALAHATVLRRYMAARWPVAGADLTAQELAQKLPRGDFPILPDRVVALAERCEAVAYARAPIASAEAERIGIEAALIVEDLEMVWVARRRLAVADTRRIKRKPLS